MALKVSPNTLSIRVRTRIHAACLDRCAPRALPASYLLVPHRISLVARSLSDDEALPLEWHPEHLTPVMPEMDVAATWDFDELRERYTQEMSQQSLMRTKGLQLPKKEAPKPNNLDMDALMQWSSKQKFAP